MASRNTSADNPFADKQRRSARSSLTGRARPEIRCPTWRTATKKVDEGRSMAADRLDSAASTVQERAGELPGGSE